MLGQGPSVFTTVDIEAIESTYGRNGAAGDAPLAAKCSGRRPAGREAGGDAAYPSDLLY